MMENGPSVVGEYHIESRLGAGGMGVVYRAVSRTGRRVVVKVIHEEYARDEEFRARFRREIVAARRVSGAYTAPVLDADPDADTPWMATLYIAGTNLSDHVRSQGPLGVPELWQLARGTAEALRDIHRAGVVHRDLKPSNVLLTDDGVRVIDFGISRATGTDTRLTKTEVFMGTPAFMAPEQFTTPKEVGGEADIFALGSLLTYAAIGHGPFDADSSHVIGYRVVYEEPDLDGVPDVLRPITLRCLEKAPGDRPSVADLIVLLDGIHTEATAPPTPPPPADFEDTPPSEAAQRIPADVDTATEEAEGEGEPEVVDEPSPNAHTAPVVIAAGAPAASAERLPSHRTDRGVAGTSAPSRRRLSPRTRWFPFAILGGVALLVAGSIALYDLLGPSGSEASKKPPSGSSSSKSPASPGTATDKPNPLPTHSGDQVANIGDTVINTPEIMKLPRCSDSPLKTFSTSLKPTPHAPARLGQEAGLKVTLTRVQGDECRYDLGRTKNFLTVYRADPDTDPHVWGKDGEWSQNRPCLDYQNEGPSRWARLGTSHPLVITYKWDFQQTSVKCAKSSTKFTRPGRYYYKFEPFDMAGSIKGDTGYFDVTG